MQTSLASLWLPIIVSGVALFFASWAAWMLLPHHKGDWKGLPNEDGLMSTLKGAGVAPGQYTFPHAATPEECHSDAFKAKMQAGPSGTLTVFNANCSMVRQLGLYLAVVHGYQLRHRVPGRHRGLPPKPGTDFMNVFQFVGTAGILVYGSSGLLNAIWFRRKVLGDIMDGIAYGLITGLIFAVLWPGGTS